VIFCMIISIDNTMVQIVDLGSFEWEGFLKAAYLVRNQKNRGEIYQIYLFFVLFYLRGEDNFWE